MRRPFFILFIICCTTSFAQTGFFLQPEIGAGMSNSGWQHFSPYFSHNHYIPFQNGIFSGELQLNAGYQDKRWEITAGLGYLNTGYKINAYRGFVPGVTQEYPSHAWPQPEITGNYSMHDPHIILPLEVGYKIPLNRKLSFTPFIGAAAMYNLPRRVVTKVRLTDSDKEPSQDFKTYCNQYSLLGIVHFNFEYTLNPKLTVTIGPSIQYMLTSETKSYSYDFPPGNFQYDYALLMNIGIKHCFSKKHIGKPTN